ncbi:hypothetical protein TRFO_20826 [Tritrichomonas foetus]|uniref:Intimal thickness related receptor IRP domain-containing protein n=1 Tax=Tritrichomonas foetus TaxID=1144522 RepID=A0A1J4KEZ4_9EUKA|nr:hypothetical protein TRFO_20826 [Tritrichomonas foetus]|eukprot:OHT10025.1 hypothetical protein TRFO_20826 [Tritrichomonas foetus]
MSNFLPEDSSKQFDLVEYENQPNADGLFLDNVSYKTLLITFLLFLCFESPYIYAGFTSSQYVNSTTLFYPLSQDVSKQEAEATVILSPFSPHHKFIRMDTTLLRKQTNRTEFRSDPLEVVRTIELSQYGKLVKNLTKPILRYTCTFEENKFESNRIWLMSEKIDGFDSLNISFSFKSVFNDIRGFNFRYEFGDPNTIKFASNIRLLLSFCAIYAYIGFIYCLRNGLNSILQYFSLTLGFFAIISTNPINQYLENPTLHALTPILMATFLAIFRIFAFFIFDTIIHNSNHANKQWAVLYTSFVAIYAIVEARVGLYDYDIFEYAGKRGLNLFDKTLIAFHITYCIVILLMFAFSYRLATKHNKFYSLVYGIFISMSVIVTILSEILLGSLNITRNTPMSLFFYQATHIIITIVFLFFQHTPETGYKNVDLTQPDLGNDDDGQAGIAPDVESSIGEEESEEEEEE